MAASKKPAAGAAPPERVRLSVRIDAARAAAAGQIVPSRRYRAGLGPFGREPVVVEAEPWQAEALARDPVLAVTEVE